MTELSPEEMLEVEADRRRRVSGALRLGSQPTAARPAGAGALAAGLAIAIAIALVFGVIALVQGSGGLGGASHSPAPVASPTPSR